MLLPKPTSGLLRDAVLFFSFESIIAFCHLNINYVFFSRRYKITKVHYLLEPPRGTHPGPGVNETRVREFALHDIAGFGMYEVAGHWVFSRRFW